MTLAQQVESRDALRELRNHTLAFLTNTTFTVQNVAGVDTAVQSMAFGCANGRAILGTAGTVNVTCGGPDCVVRNVAVQATPMRLQNAGAGRTAATARVAGGAGPPLWVTTRQSGCSVLIVDWGGSLSMVHLQPSLVGDYRWRLVRGLINLSLYTNRETHRYSLQHEMTLVVTATRGVGPAPQRYILAQSGWTRAGGHFLGVTGIRDNANAWTFFLQEYTLGAVIAARQLNWTAWNHWGPYAASAY